MTDPVASSPNPTAVPSGTAPASGERVTIKVRKNGSLLVTGDFALVDHEGREIPRPAGKPNVALCRCGHSARKPFCDAAHRTCGFIDPPDPVPGAATQAPGAGAGNSGVPGGPAVPGAPPT